MSRNFSRVAILLSNCFLLLHVIIAFSFVFQDPHYVWGYNVHSKNIYNPLLQFFWKPVSIRSRASLNKILSAPNVTFTYVPTLLFWTMDSRFEMTAPALPVLPEISRFEMIPVWMSDIYEFFKSITLFTNSIWKPWLLITKLGACVALIHHLHHQL